MRWQPPLKLNILRRHCKANGFQKKKKTENKKKLKIKTKLGSLVVKLELRSKIIEFVWKQLIVLVFYNFLFGKLRFPKG